MCCLYTPVQWMASCLQWTAGETCAICLNAFEFKKMITTLEAREAAHRKSGESSSYVDLAC